MLAVRLILAAVFVVSALTKAIAPRRTGAAARELGVPSALAPVVAVLLPAAELAVAALLVVTPTVLAGGTAATALMATFTALVAGNLIRGRRPACACFGALSAAEPIGPSTLVRNGVLLAASVAVLVAASLPGRCGAGCYDAAGARAVAIVGGLAVLTAVAVGALLIHAMSRTVGALAGRVRDLEGALGRVPATGRPAVGPAVDMASLQAAVTTATVMDRDGTTVPLTEVAGEVAGRPGPTLLVLMSAQCSACERLRERIRTSPPPPGLSVLGVIDRVDAGLATGPGDGLAVYADGGRIAASAGVQAFPSAVLLDAALRPVGGVLTGTTEIRRFLDQRAVLPHAVTEGVAHHV